MILNQLFPPPEPWLVMPQCNYELNWTIHAHFIEEISWKRQTETKNVKWQKASSWGNDHNCHNIKATIEQLAGAYFNIFPLSNDI